MKHKFWQWLAKAAKFSRPFFFEFIVLVVGIMLSLWLNDRRQNAEAHKDEKQTLLQVIEDLKDDTARIANNLSTIKELSQLSVRLIQMNDDSVNAAFLRVYNDVREVVVYIPFEPSKVGYMELSTQGKSGKVTDKRLVMDIMGLYEKNYKEINRLTEVHRDYLVNKIYTYISENMPYFGKKSDLTDERKLLFAKALQSDEFRHMLFFDIVLKQNLEEAYTRVYEEQKILIKKIEKELIG